MFERNDTISVGPFEILTTKKSEKHKSRCNGTDKRNAGYYTLVKDRYSSGNYLINAVGYICSSSRSEIEVTIEIEIDRLVISELCIKWTIKLHETIAVSYLNLAFSDAVIIIEERSEISLYNFEKIIIQL